RGQLASAAGVAWASSVAVTTIAARQVWTFNMRQSLVTRLVPPVGPSAVALATSDRRSRLRGLELVGLRRIDRDDPPTLARFTEGAKVLSLRGEVRSAACQWCC